MPMVDDDGMFADESAPDDVPQQDDPPTYGKNNRELPDDLKLKLEALILKLQDQEMYDRRVEVLMDRIHRFYYDGVQHVYPNWSTGVYQVGTAGGYVDIGNNQQVQCPMFMGAYNYWRGEWQSLDGVLTQNPPGIGFAPDRPQESESIEAAETAEGFWEMFDQAEKGGQVKRIQKRASYLMGHSGRVVAWTKTLKSRARFGLNDEGEARSMETADVYGTMESKVPIVCRNWAEAPYCFLFDDKNVLSLKAQNEWIRTKITPGEPSIGESDWNRFARIGVKQAKKGFFLTGLALNYLTTELNGFLRPEVFEDGLFNEAYPGAEETDVREDGKTFTYRDKFQQLFPDGCHVKWVGKTYSESWNECPDDAIDVVFPMERDGMTGGALMEPMKVVQDVINDYLNAKRENYETGWSVTYFKGSDEDYQAISNQRSRPNDYVLLKEGPPEQEIGKQIVYREPPVAPPEGFDEAIEQMTGQVAQFLTGALPALQGDAKASQTASGQAMDRSQAMGRLGPAWAYMQILFAGIAEKAARLASKNPDHGTEIAIVGKDGGKITVKMERLKKGKFHAHVADSSFPETTAAKRANLADLIKMAAASPVGQTLFQSPDNWEEFLELNGNPDLVLIPAIAFKKQSRELEQLLQEAPIVPTPEDIAAATMQHAQQQIQAEQQASAMGTLPPAPTPFQPPQPQPSLMPEADDYHQWESAKCQEYLSSEDCWLRMNVAQPDQGMDPAMALQQAQLGIQNVRLHKAVHDQFLQQQQQAQAQMQQQMKPPSESINFKDESPAGQTAMNAQAGIKAAAPEAQGSVQKKAASPGTKGTATV
jgi:hypothetical protein